MAKFYLDCEELPVGDREPLEKALSEAITSDMPLTLELLFVSEEEIRSLNSRERNVDRVTDVLSFPAMELAAGEGIVGDEHGECIEPVAVGEENGELLEEERLLLGSVVICTKRAEEQAEEYGHSLAREICYLTVHGTLHCLGYDHETEEEKRVMRAKEEEIMEKIGLRREE